VTRDRTRAAIAALAIPGEPLPYRPRTTVGALAGATLTIPAATGLVLLGAILAALAS
jgi:hypothetical protein